MTDYIPYINLVLLIFAAVKMTIMIWLVKKVNTLLKYQGAELHQLNVRNAKIMRFVQNSSEEVTTEEKGS